MKLVIDVNILLVIIGSKSPYRWIFDNLITGKFRLCVTTEILFEYFEILEQKTNREVAENVVNFIVASKFTEMTDVFYNFKLIKSDPDDNKYVDCAIAGNVNYIISNDRHFRVLKEVGFPKVIVLTLNEFKNTLEQ